MSHVRGLNRLSSFLAVGCLFLIIGGCSQQAIISAVGPNGTLTILRPDDTFTRALESGRLVILGDPPPASLVLTQHNSIPVLKFYSP